MMRESTRNLEREVSARFGLPAPTIYSQVGQRPGLALSRLACDEFGHGPSKPVEPEDAYVLHIMLRDVDRYDLELRGERVVRAPAPHQAVFLGALRNQPIAHLDTPFDIIRIYVTQAVLDDHANTLGITGSVNLQTSRQGCKDPILGRLVRAVLPVFDQVFDYGQLFVDSLSLAIQDHLLRAYASDPLEAPTISGRLAPRLEKRAKDFMQSRLAEGASLEEIATHCGLSPSHFSKAFRVSTGRPPHRWLLERRIEHAKSMLLDDNFALADVARNCGFSDSSHLSRTFSQFVREPPASWRRRNRE